VIVADGWRSEQMGSKPHYGGTLRLYGPGSMDHVDPACSYFMLAGAGPE
jgi:hypothetical protein